MIDYMTEIGYGCLVFLAILYGVGIINLYKRAKENDEKFDTKSAIGGFLGFSTLALASSLFFGIIPK